MIEVDFSIDPDSTLLGLTPEWSTLYNTPYWDQMTEADKAVFTRHEMAAVMHIGIWFEMILQQLLLREQYCGKYSTNEFQFTLIEVGDECRHSLMFAKAGLLLSDGVNYRPSLSGVKLGNMLKTVGYGAPAYVGILFGEFLLDIMQKDLMIDDRVLPMVRAVSNIHVVEESRHMAFAKEEIKAKTAHLNRAESRLAALSCAFIGYQIMRELTQKDVYHNSGLPEGAYKQARTNDYHNALLAEKSKPLMGFVEESGLLTPESKRIYRKAHML